MGYGGIRFGGAYIHASASGNTIQISSIQLLKRGWCACRMADMVCCTVGPSISVIYGLHTIRPVFLFCNINAHAPLPWKTAPIEILRSYAPCPLALSIPKDTW